MDQEGGKGEYWSETGCNHRKEDILSPSKANKVSANVSTTDTTGQFLEGICGPGSASFISL
jgi:hypothetical protein